MRLRWVLIALALAALAGCGGKDGGTKQEATPMGTDSTALEVDTTISPDTTMELR